MRPSPAQCGAGPRTSRTEPPPPVSYEDEESIAAKGQFVRSRGLGRLPSAPSGSRDPLLKAVHQAFLQP